MTMKSAGGHQESEYAARANAGASGGDIGVAGSFALNVSDTHSEGVIPGTVTVNAGTGALALGAANASKGEVEAKASAGGTTGIGASIGINTVDNITRA